MKESVLGRNWSKKAVLGRAVRHYRWYRVCMGGGGRGGGVNKSVLNSMRFSLINGLFCFVMFYSMCFSQMQTMCITILVFLCFCGLFLFTSHQFQLKRVFQCWNWSIHASRCLSGLSPIHCLNDLMWNVCFQSGKPEDQTSLSLVELSQTSNLVLQGLPHQLPGITGSVLKPAGLVSVHCDWVRQQVLSALLSQCGSTSIVLSRSLLESYIVCCWDVNQETTVFLRFLWKQFQHGSGWSPITHAF